MAEKLYEDALKLPADKRAELTDLLIESLAEDVPAETAKAQLEEVRRRIAEVESGNVALIPGDEALAQVRRLLLAPPRPGSK
jgi:putative addiction module component (TIGR02574 family)